MNYPAASGRSIKRPAAQNKFAASGGELNPKMIKELLNLKMLRRFWSWQDNFMRKPAYARIYSLLLYDNVCFRSFFVVS
jgi:hypothetical protein